MTPSLKWCWGWKRFSSLEFYLGDNVFLLGREMLMKKSPPDYNSEVIGIWPEIWSYENFPSKASYTHVMPLDWHSDVCLSLVSRAQGGERRQGNKPNRSIMGCHAHWAWVLSPRTFIAFITQSNFNNTWTSLGPFVKDLRVFCYESLYYRISGSQAWTGLERWSHQRSPSSLLEKNCFQYPWRSKWSWVLGDHL